MHKINQTLKHTEALQKALKKCKENGLKLTGPRTAVLKVMAREHGPFTAEEVYKKMHSKDCDVVTIYRNLSHLESLGILKKCDFGDGAARYELLDHDDHHHHHIICRSCKKIEALAACKLKGLDALAKKMGFSKVSHSLEFFGLCEDCA